MLRHLAVRAAVWPSRGLGGAVSLTAASAVPAAHMHAAARAESAVLIGGLSVAGAAVAGVYMLRAYERMSATAMSSPAASGQGDDASSGASTPPGGSTSGAGAAGSGGASASAPPPQGFFSRMFGAQALAKRFYRGGFEEKMSRREAALILGVRESADPARIRDRHRKLLMQNHPDQGGSTFIAGKLNEAKELLTKGKK